MWSVAWQALAEALALRLYGFSLDLSGCDMGDDLLKLLAFALQLAQRLELKR